MPWGLYRFQQSRQLHFITFSCYRRQPFLNTPKAKHVFERSLEQTRRSYSFYVIGYVVMPEHVHLLVTEPARSTLAAALQALKQSVSQKLIGHHSRFWQARYYDFNVRSVEKRIEKLKYVHRNPVKRGFVEKPEDWTWSSYRHYALDEECIVEIESPWTAYKRKHPKTDPTELSHIFEYRQPENVTLATSVRLMLEDKSESPNGDGIHVAKHPKRRADLEERGSPYRHRGVNSPLGSRVVGSAARTHMAKRQEEGQHARYGHEREG